MLGKKCVMMPRKHKCVVVFNVVVFKIFFKIGFQWWWTIYLSGCEIFMHVAKQSVTEKEECCDA